MKLLLPLLAVLSLIPFAAVADEPLPLGHYRFTDVTVNAIDRTKVGDKWNDADTGKLTHWIRFDVRPKYVVDPGTNRLPFKIVNPSVASKTSLTVDKPIEFNGEKVPAGTNLLKYKKFNGSRFTIHVPELFPLAIHSATLHSGFKLPKDTYKFTFEWTTATGETFKKTVEVFVDVELPASR